MTNNHCVCSTFRTRTNLHSHTCYVDPKDIVIIRTQRIVTCGMVHGLTGRKHGWCDIRLTTSFVNVKTFLGFNYKLKICYSDLFNVMFRSPCITHA